MMWTFLRKRKRRKRATSVTKHYVENKEAARKLVISRLAHFNKFYNLEWKRVAIRNQRRCWGSCSSLKNLNFNYKILLLPPHLRDYIIVHELCHLVELNHKQPFWNLVSRAVPDYKTLVTELRTIDKGGNSVPYLLKVQEAYLANYSIKKEVPEDDLVQNESHCEHCGEEMICTCSMN